MRLFPLLCSMATLVLFGRLVRRWLPPAFACLALGSVAFGHVFLDYATECKQYASDGFVALGLLEMADIIGEDIQRLRRQGARRVWLIYDRRDDSLSRFAATQGRILKRYDFQRGYVLLLEFS